MPGMMSALALSLWCAATIFPDAEQLPALKDRPDPLVLENGARVRTPEDWPARREEIKAMLLHYEYGHLPPAPDNLRVEHISTGTLLDGKSELTRVTLVMGPEERVRMQVGVHAPTTPGKHPVLLALEPVWQQGLYSAASAAVGRGYIFAGFDKHDLDPDDADRSNGLHAAYPDCDGATLAAWAWGALRAVDYLCQRDDVDSAHIALTGHSRAGKTALLAAALDERIALVAPHGSGSGGAGSFRMCPKKAESLAMITSPNRFHYWFHPRLAAFRGREDRLPFDQHFLRALVAPRVVVSMDGYADLWANPLGTRLMGIAARPVFDLLGVPGHNVTFFRPGGHDMTDGDWNELLNYCDRFFFGKPLPQASQAAP